MKPLTTAAPNLFTGLARATDPTTSHAAAKELVESGELGRRARYALSVVDMHPGCTAAELERKVGCPDGFVRKRLRGLAASKHITVGKARDCTITKRKCLTWFPVAAEARAAS